MHHPKLLALVPLPQTSAANLCRKSLLSFILHNNFIIRLCDSTDGRSDLFFPSVYIHCDTCNIRCFFLNHISSTAAAAFDCAASITIPPTPLRRPQIMNKTPPSKQIWNPAFKQI
ncbi:hypothetical protein ACQRIU_000362 [Beauveria bassiana]